MGNQDNWKRKSVRKIQPIEVVNEAREKLRIGMKRQRLLAKEHASSSIVDEPSTNKPPLQVVDEQRLEDLVDVGYSANEIKDDFDAISPVEEVPVMRPPIQQHDVLETPQ